FSRDWSSDVCSSDLERERRSAPAHAAGAPPARAPAAGAVRAGTAGGARAPLAAGGRHRTGGGRSPPPVPTSAPGGRSVQTVRDGRSDQRAADPARAPAAGAVEGRLRRGPDRGLVRRGR